MELQFWGAAQTVTGSMHLLKVNGHQILLDCGMYQGRRKNAFELNNNFPFDPTSIDALIVSHAHIDHTGNIPTFVKHGYRGPIWATPATQGLCNIMLRDSAYIQEADVAYINKRRAKEGKRLFEPLYRKEDALQALSQFRPMGYRTPFEPVPGVQIHYREAGHVFGSASVTIDIDDGGKQKRLVFSGDIGRKNMSILRDPAPVDDADFIIMESTYGKRNHKPADQARHRLKEAVLKAADVGGKIVIPAFAVGRTQEIVYSLHEMFDYNKIPDIDIFIDSPSAVKATKVFEEHPEIYDEETKDFLSITHSKNPFAFPGVKYIQSREESMAINDHKGAAIIISASGMCEGGRVLHHLKHHISNDRNTVLFVGYQGPHTLGRKILDGNDYVPILGREIPVRANIMRINGYSAHADHDGLLDWLGMAQDQGDPQKLFLVHGELESAEILAKDAKAQGIPQAYTPGRGQSFDL
ncbi:MAG: MBL fold metallo-hydrolase [Chloroflexota bacterium]